MDLQLTIIDDTDTTGDGFLRFTEQTPAYTLTGERTTIPPSVRHAHAIARSAALNGSGYIVGNIGQPLLFVGLSVAPKFVPFTRPDAPADPAALEAARTEGAASEKSRLRALLGL